MSPHHTQTGDMSMRNTVRWLFLHLGKHVSHDLGVIMFAAAVALIVAFPWSNYSYKAELWPCKGVIKIVFEEVVLGKIGDVACLY